MKLISLLILLPLSPLVLLPVYAEESIRAAQESLKGAGFYYGPITGDKNEETAAALRRFQIRNGLEVTGDLNEQTQAALASAQSAGSAQPPAEEPSAAQPPTQEPDAPITPIAPVLPSPAPQPSVPSGVQAPAQPTLPPGAREALIPFSQIFGCTPYQSAPLPVQQQTLRNAQEHLAKRGYYQGPLDAVPTRGMRRSIASFQDANGLKPTGNLDVDTLHQMRLLPGESASGFRTQTQPQKRIYRGIEVR